MSKTKKHEMTKEEVRAPDEFQVALESFWQKLVRYKKVILLAIAAFVAVGIAIWVMGLSKKSSAQARALAQRDATVAIGAAVGKKDENAPPPEPGIPEPLRFEDDVTRLAAVDAGLTKFLSEHGTDDAAELAILAAANVKLAQGKATEAGQAVEQWLAGHDAKTPAWPVALDLKARALLAQGQNDQAAAALDQLSQASTGPLKAHVLTRLGDLLNPALHAGKGDSSKAKAAYEGAIAALPPKVESGDQLSMLLGGGGDPKADLQNKIELLP